MYQTGGTIRETIEAIQRNDFVLPAIQREFVWKPEQIGRLFDSLMQGYPFGTFLYWRVEKENSADYRFYGFVRDYHEREHPHCPQLPTFHDTSLTAVLDGQQRLTALYIGLCGSMAWRVPYKWKNNPNAYPTRHLHLDLLAHSTPEEEGGEAFRFEFLTEEQVASAKEEECWFRVSDILGMKNPTPEIFAWLNARLPQDRTSDACVPLDRLYQVVHNQPLIAYYEERSQKLQKVLNIFIRMNSGGTVLSYSDLLLSIAVAQWKEDARTEIHTLVDDLNATGERFSFSKDLVLKAGLMLAEVGNVGFKVENFNRKNMETLEARWPDVKRALRVSVELLASFGFNDQSLRADSAILPIAYYVCRRGLGHDFVTKGKYASDRESIRQWLIRSLLKASGIWGSGLDSLLTALRETIAKQGDESFPSEKLGETMAKRGKSLSFGEEEIEELLDIKYGDKRLFALLSLLFPFVDTRKHFHIDHVFPKSRFTKSRLIKAGVPEEDVAVWAENANELANLQLLEGSENVEKKATMPATWLIESFPEDGTRANYCQNHLLGSVPDALVDFPAFYEARREALRSQIVTLLGRANVRDGASQ